MMKTENKEVNNKGRKFRLSYLFRNNQFLMLISLFLAFAIWVNMALSDDSETSITISNIPVQIELSADATDSGLKIFSGAEQYASVTVTGNRLALGKLSTEDIVVSAQSVGTVTGPGPYTLSLTARKTDSSDSFSISSSSISPSFVSIYVDHADKASFEVENRVSYNVAEGYYADVSLSSKKITVSGPETEISKIKSVGIEGSIKGELKKSKEMDFEIKLYDQSGNVYSNNMLSLSEKRITAVFSVEPQRELSLAVKYKNQPKGLVISLYEKIKPSSIIVAGPSDVLSDMNSILTAEVDFSTLDNKKVALELELDVPRKFTNLSEITTAKVIYDFRDMKKNVISVSDFSIKNLPNGYSYDVLTESLQITVIGDKDSLKNINSKNVHCVIDASNIVGTTGSISLPVEIVIDNESCWAYGNYSANVSVSK